MFSLYTNKLASIIVIIIIIDNVMTRQVHTQNRETGPKLAELLTLNLLVSIFLPIIITVTSVCELVRLLKKDSAEIADVTTSRKM
jgi:hypothetical protein